MDQLEAAAVREWAHAARSALDAARDRIDAVNVFPVAAPESSSGNGTETVSLVRPDP